MFGKNKVNYTDFKWQYIPTKNFDIYYTEGGYEIALIASEIAEYSYEILSKHWNYTPQKRIPLLIYNSHNDFTQTNVITEIISEGTGGFTELFKNRVVLPWEGSLDKFKHVIHHELTHALMFDMLYGGLIDSIIGREYMFQVPLWFAEGLAEHESQYWSIEGDMIVRDGIINGYLPPIQYISSGYLVYKGGESFFKFLQEEYGGPDRWLAGELLESLRMTKNIDTTFKAIFGKSVEDLSEIWQRRLRAEHWPDVKDREIPEDFATILTDHRELNNYININPTFNPT
ncbi:biopolymer transporter Tol, partial [Candidatus Latescibacterota bacterium]